MVKRLPFVFLLAGLSTPVSAAPPTLREAMPVPTELNCDSLAIHQRLDAATLRDLGPAHSLEAAAAVLDKHGVKFERGQGVMTSVPPKILQDLYKLPQGEPIIVPNGEGGSAICVLRPSEDSI